MRPLLFAFFCLLLSGSTRIAGADPARSSGLRSDILYTAAGEFVQVGPMRPLTLNAHVEQFAYNPLGTEAAVVGSEAQGSQTAHFVKTVDTRTGQELSRLTVVAPTSDRSAGFTLLGWSLSGKYLMLIRYTPDPHDPSTPLADYLRWDLSADPSTLRVIAPEAQLPRDVQPIEGTDYAFASPDGRWIVFKEAVQGQDSEGKPGPQQDSYLRYDPDRDTFRPLALPKGAVNTYQWGDNSHLNIWDGDVRKQVDIATGQVSARSVSPKVVAPAASSQYPDLTLGVESSILEDPLGSGGERRAYIVWIQRMPLGKAPLGAVAAGVLLSNHEAGGSGEDKSQAAWSPTGRQVAFLANNDLYVTDLTTATGLLPHEKMAVGLPLTCADEQALAVSNLKQIGLGVIQYAQAHNEEYPSGDGLQDKLAPYLEAKDVFQVGDHKFVYEKATSASLAQPGSPGTVEDGYLDLPCARVALFADGQVKAFPKTQSADAKSP